MNNKVFEEGKKLRNFLFKIPYWEIFCSG